MKKKLLLALGIVAIVGVGVSVYVYFTKEDKGVTVQVVDNARREPVKEVLEEETVEEETPEEEEVIEEQPTDEERVDEEKPLAEEVTNETVEEEQVEQPVGESNAPMEEEHIQSTISDTYTYLNDNYKIREDNETYTLYGQVRNLTLTKEEFCKQEAFDEFLDAIGFDSGEIVRFTQMDDNLYYADYANCTLQYNYSLDTMTLNKQTIEVS